MSDLLVHSHGSIVLLQGVSDFGKEWIDENIMSEETVTFAGQIAVEPRYVQNIIDGAERDGLLVG